MSYWSLFVLIGLITISSANYLPFVSPSNYSVFTDVDDSTVPVYLPTPTQFGSKIYNIVYINSNGFISFGVSNNNFYPQPFPYHDPILAPYWDDIQLTGSRQIRYALLTPSNSSSIIDGVNCLLSSFTRTRISVDWVLWTYWHDVCPYSDPTCNNHESNHFQALLAVHNNSTYSIFTYQCDLIRWTRHNAIIGFSANNEFYSNHTFSSTNNITDVDCHQNTSSGYTNIIYQLNDLSALTIWPPYGSILGGDMIRVSGPHNLSTSEDIKLSFDEGKVFVNCTHINNTQTAHCVAPFLNKEGKVNVWLHYNNTVYNRTALYHSIPMENDPKVAIGNNTKRYFTSGDKINITWSPTTFSDSPTSKVDVSLYEVKEMPDGTFDNKKLTELATGIPNNGQAVVTIPMGSDNNNVRSVNILVQKNITTNDMAMGSSDITRDIKQWTGSLWVSRTSASNNNTNFLYQKCLQWSQSDSGGSSLLTSTTPCPPTASRAATVNSGFKESNFLISVFHPEASRCFRQRVATSTGSGNQCCYGDNDALIVGSPSGGSVDKVALTGTGLTYWSNLIDHFTEDVLPYIYCCKGQQRNCNKYYEKRPSDDGSRFRPPVPACVYGDPHIVTLDLHKYTFNGKGEFTLIESYDQSLLRVQGRMVEATDMNGNDAPGTVFSAVAAKQGNSDTVQFEIDEIDEFICLVNGEKIDFDIFKTEEFDNVTVSTLGENNTFSATFSSGAFIRVEATNGFISVLIVSLPDSYRGQTRGLMGNFNGNTSDDLMPKNGVSGLSLNSSLQQIHYNFGLSWIVNSSTDSLFSYPCGRSWVTYYHPTFRPSFEPTFSDPSLEQTANEICGDDQFCKFDIAATGRVEIGEATFTGGQNLEQLVNLSQPIICNPPCLHGACVSTDVCACSEGYTGATCDSIVTIPCSDNPCNGGICEYHAGSFICTCPPDMTGEFCEENYTTPCTNNPCQSGGTCLFEHGTLNFTCVCPPELTGKLCELNKTTPCTKNPCKSGGTCNEQGTTNFTCICPPDYTGILCETKEMISCPSVSKSTDQFTIEWVLPVLIILIIITVTSVCVSIVLAGCLIKERSKGTRQKGPSNMYEFTDKQELVARDGEGGFPTVIDGYEPVQHGTYKH